MQYNRKTQNGVQNCKSDYIQWIWMSICRNPTCAYCCQPQSRATQPISSEEWRLCKVCTLYTYLCEYAKSSIQFVIYQIDSAVSQSQVLVFQSLLHTKYSIILYMSTQKLVALPIIDQAVWSCLWQKCVCVGFYLWILFPQLCNQLINSWSWINTRFSSVFLFGGRFLCRIDGS